MKVTKRHEKLVVITVNIQLSTMMDSWKLKQIVKKVKIKIIKKRFCVGFMPFYYAFCMRGQRGNWGYIKGPI